MQGQWVLKEDISPALTDAQVHEQAEALGISDGLVRLLAQRGLPDREAMDIFLSPHLRHLAPPQAYPGLVEAAQVLAKGIAADLPFAVWGDYDVDGVTSCALVLDFLAKYDLTARHYIPDRQAGYGLNKAGVEELAAAGVRLLLTVDCGITAVDEVARAKELGMTVVIADHHLPEDRVPAADAVVNPRMGECPCQDLAAVGVTFLLMAALNNALPGEKVSLADLLDLVALGTIADVMKLTGQNRILVKNGLLLIKEAARPGMAALKEASGYTPTAELGAGQIGFGLAPRINAAGRLEDANTALHLLRSPDYETARPIAHRLDEVNSRRREQERLMVEEAKEQAAKFPTSQGLVLFAPHWHSGIIGIVASRIVDYLYRPTVILTRDGEQLKGSGRSTREFDLHTGLEECSGLLTGFGGHKQAAGLTLNPALLEDFRTAFSHAVIKQCGPVFHQPTLFLDGELPFAAIDLTLLRELELLQPFGPGNAEPVFASGPVCVTMRRRFGKDHVRLELTEEESAITLKAIAWGQAHTLSEKIYKRRLRIAFSPRLDHYNGVAGISLLIKDWKLLPL